MHYLGDPLPTSTVNAILKCGLKRLWLLSLLIFSLADKLLDCYIAHLSDPLHFARMGFSLALGGLPKSLLVGRLDHVMHHLTGCVTNIKGTDPKFVEARRDAIRAITRCAVHTYLYYI